jgi:glycine dehydrogenase
VEATVAPAFAAELARTSAYLSHPVFNRYHSETEMLRYLRRWPTRTWRWTAP